MKIQKCITNDNADRFDHYEMLKSMKWSILCEDDEKAYYQYWCIQSFCCLLPCVLGVAYAISPSVNHLALSHNALAASKKMTESNDVSLRMFSDLFHGSNTE